MQFEGNAMAATSSRILCIPMIRWLCGNPQIFAATGCAYSLRDAAAEAKLQARVLRCIPLRDVRAVAIVRDPVNYFLEARQAHGLRHVVDKAGLPRTLDLMA